MNAPRRTAPAAEKTAPVPVAPRRRAQEVDAPSPVDDAAAEETEAEKKAPAKPLTVRVTKTGTNDPVVGANVVAEDDACVRHEATTGDDGVAHFDPPLEGGYARIDVSAPGMTRAHAFADADAMSAGAQVKLELAEGTSLDGIVIDDATGRGVAGARVTVDDPDERLRDYDATVTGADGTFRFEGFPETRAMTVSAQEPHHAPGHSIGKPGQLGRLEIRLLPAGVIRGVVRDPYGAPVRGATVVARAVWTADDQAAANVRPGPGPLAIGASSGPVSADTDADGAYEIGGLDLRPAWLATASADGFIASEQGTALPIPEQTHELVRDLALRRAAAVEVRASRPGGVPAAGASVRIDQPGMPAVFGRTDAAGACTISPRAAGPSIVRVELAPFPAITRTVQAVPGERATVEVEIGGGAVLAGVVVDDLGKPIPGASVSVVAKADPYARNTTAAEDGTFRFEHLAPGAAWLVASRKTGDTTCPRVDATVPGEGVLITIPRPGGVTFRLRAPVGVTPTKVAWWSESVATIHAEEWTGGTMRVEVEAGTVKLHLSADGALAVTRTIDVASGKDTALGDIELQAAPPSGGTIRVTVRGAGRDAVSVQLVRATVQFWMQKLTARDDGSFEKRVETGRWRVSVVRGDTTVATKDVDVADGADVSVEFDLTK